MANPLKKARLDIDAPHRPLTKSRFKLGWECPTKLYYQDRPHEFANCSSDDAFLRNLARGGFQVGALAKHLFPGGHDIVTLDAAPALAETNRRLHSDPVTIYEGAFRFENLLIRADIVQRDGNTLRLYEVKAKSFHPADDDFWNKKRPDQLLAAWKEYLFDVAFQHFVLSGAFPEWKVVPYLIFADKSAVATVDGLNQRFRLVKENGRERVDHDPTLTADALGASILCTVDVSKEVAAIQAGRANGAEPPDWPAELSFAEWVRQLADGYANDHRFRPRVSDQCKDCQFRVSSADYPGLRSGFESCWTEALALRPGELAQRRPVFDLWKNSAAALLGRGAYFFDQCGEEDFIPKSKPKGSPAPGLSTVRRKVLQWERTLTEKPGPYFDRAGFLEETAGVHYPLHFIDFETTTVAIPFHRGRRPYEQIAFQFSHHLLSAPGAAAEHAGQWIHAERGRFPNFEFVRALKRELEKDSGTIFRYANHENTVLCQIREQLRQLPAGELTDRDELVAWIETIAEPRASDQPWTAPRPMIDMLELVLRYFWHPRMGGSNSIKVVLPAMLECSSFLQARYREPVYGTSRMPSLNNPATTWIQFEDGKPRDPYRLLPPVFDRHQRVTLDRLFSDDELADGGAAMMAYSKMQFSEMSDEERRQIREALLRYCELDTLAMVMLWEGWQNLPDHR